MKKIKNCLCDECKKKISQLIEIEPLTWNKSRAAVNLIKSQIREGAKMLPRSAKFLKKNKTFVAKNGFGKVVGVICLRVWDENNVEVVANAVEKDFQKKGVGKKLVKKALLESCRIYPRLDCLFLCTTETEFYEKQGFDISDSQGLVQKMQTDCKECEHGPKGPGHGSCPEIVMKYYQGLKSLRNSNC